MNNLTIPNHIALICDGNRRWARQRGLAPWRGHRAGAKATDNFVKWSLELEIPQISVWVGSTENISTRPKREVEELYKLYYEFLSQWEKDKTKSMLEKYKIKVRFIGDIEKLPSKLVRLMGKIMRNTTKNQKRVLNVLINYGGKFELLEAFKKVANKMLKAGKIEITEKDIENNLFVQTPIDLIIRTGGQSRLSNFMLWQGAYSEIYVTKTLLPDFSKKEFMKAIRWFSKVKRNFGG